MPNEVTVIRGGPCGDHNIIHKNININVYMDIDADCIYDNRIINDKAVKLSDERKSIMMNTKKKVIKHSLRSVTLVATGWQSRLSDNKLPISLVSSHELLRLALSRGTTWQK